MRSPGERGSRWSESRRRAWAVLALAAVLAPVASCDGTGAPGVDEQKRPAPERAARPGPRVVSLSPSVTAIVLALDAEASLVGVDASSARLEPRVATLPTVGGLFNPSLEAIVALKPDLVALVPSAQQRGLETRLDQLGIDVLALRNVSTQEVIASIGVLGERLGRREEARLRVLAIREAWAQEPLPDPSKAPGAVIVLQRDPLYVVGSGSYLDAMLVAAGAHNLAAVFDEPYPRVSVEWLIEAQPALILDAADPAADAHEHWSRWPSLPAVRDQGVRVLEKSITVPGPFLDASLELLRRHVAPGGSS